MNDPVLHHLCRRGVCSVVKRIVNKSFIKQFLPPVVCRRAHVLFMLFVLVCRRVHVLFMLFVFVCRRAHVLFMLFVFVCIKWCPTNIVLCFSWSCERYVFSFSGLSIFYYPFGILKDNIAIGLVCRDNNLLVMEVRHVLSNIWESEVQCCANPHWPPKYSSKVYCWKLYNQKSRQFCDMQLIIFFKGVVHA